MSRYSTNALVYSPTLLTCQIDAYGSPAEHHVEILSAHIDDHKIFTPAKWLFYFQKPYILPAGNVTFRDALPLITGPVRINFQETKCSAFLFDHELQGGFWFAVGLAINVVGILMGCLWSFKWHDPQTGFTIGAISGLPMSLVGVCIMVFKI
jgi:hypothetical protein